MKRSLRTLAAAVGGTLHGVHGDADPLYGDVSTDTRTLDAGALFVGLRGPKFNGDEFVAAAASAGAVAAMVSRPMPVELPQVVVADTLLALQALARAWRTAFSLPLVAIAGSNGKTTTKEMTAAILRQRGPCLATRGNLNNHIGVPLTLMGLDATHRSAVIELGANRRGDVAELCGFAQPTVGLITNAGAEHLEGFGDLDGVAQGEGEAVASLRSDATAVINADDPYADYWRGLAGGRPIRTFGVQRPADFTATGIAQTIERGDFLTRFMLRSPAGEVPVTLVAGGAHNIVNALAASAAAAAAGATVQDIAAGLGAFRPVAGRLQLKAGPLGSQIIDDSYNANPSSVRAGLEVLAGLQSATWFVCGEMAELGPESAALHAGIGSYARECGVQRLFAVGAGTHATVDAFGGGAEWFADVQALTARVHDELCPGVTILVKGSRINRLERVVQALTRTAPALLPEAG